MNSQDKVSILIPVYNRVELVGETIKSAFAQTYRNIEVVVVDNNSTDGTWELLTEYKNKFPDMVLHRNQRNIGPVANWKVALNLANGEYAKFLWSDDLIAEDFIEKTISFMKNNVDAGFVFTKTVLFSQQKSQVIKHMYSIGDTGCYPAHFYIDSMMFGEEFPVSPGCALFRTKDLKKYLIDTVKHRELNEGIKKGIGTDLLFFLLVADKYNKFCFIDLPLSFFRHHKGSISIENRESTSYIYDLSKAFYLENFCSVDKQTRMKRFNAVLFLRTLKRNGFTKNPYYVVSDCYYDKKIGIMDIDYVYLFRYFLKKLGRKWNHH